jgi:hypothetical protein
MSIINQAVISEGECLTLERVWYELQGLNNLVKEYAAINSNVSKNLIRKYVLANTSYQLAWKNILKNNFKEDYTNNPDVAWSCSFEDALVKITDNKKTDKNCPCSI